MSTREGKFGGNLVYSEKITTFAVPIKTAGWIPMGLGNKQLKPKIHAYENQITAPW